MALAYEQGNRYASPTTSATIIYTIDDNGLVVAVITLGHRGDVYDR